MSTAMMSTVTIVQTLCSTAGVPAWTEQSALRTAALNLSSLSPAAWHHALSRMLRYESPAILKSSPSHPSPSP